MKAEKFSPKDAQFPKRLIALNNAETLGQDVREGLRSSREEGVGYGMSFEVLKESLLEKELPQGITLADLSGRFEKRGTKDKAENVLVLNGTASINILGKKVDFGLTLGNKDDKVVMQDLQLSGLMGRLARPFVESVLSDLDGTIKNEVNKKIGSAGKVISCVIGDEILECTVSRS